MPIRPRRRTRPAATNVSLQTEVCEQRQLLSATFTDPAVDDAAIQNSAPEQSLSGDNLAELQQVTVSYTAPTGGWGLQINAVVRTPESTWVFATAVPPAAGTVVTQAFEQISDQIFVALRSDDLPVQELVRRLDDPGCELDTMLASGDAQLLFSRQDSNASAWNQCSDHRLPDLELQSQSAPDAIDDAIISRDSEYDTAVGFFWGEGGVDHPLAAQPHFRRYHIEIHSLSAPGTGDPIWLSGDNSDTSDTVEVPPFHPQIRQPDLVFHDRDLRVATVDGVSKAFGGAFETELSPGVYSIRLRQQVVPFVDPQSELFTDGADAVNMLGTPWSEWGTPLVFTVLPEGQEILTLPVRETTTQTPDLQWGPVEGAVGYEIWINDTQSGRPVLQAKDVQRPQFVPEEPLPWGDYRFWVRAVRQDGSRTAWSERLDLRLRPPAVHVHSITNSVDRTPVIRWEPQSGVTGYRVVVTGLERVSDSPRIDFTSRDDAAVFVSPARVAVDVAPTQTEYEVEVPLPSGQYGVTVTAVFAHGVAGNPGHTVLHLDEVRTPVVPQSGRTVRWEARPDIQSSDIWVARLRSDDDSASPDWRYLVQEGIAGNSLTLPDDAPAGDYRVWVRYRYLDGRQDREASTEWSLAADWSLRPEDPPSGLQLQYSAESGRLSWNASDRPGSVSYDVLVAVVDSRGRSTLHTEIRGLPATTYDLDDLAHRYPPGAVGNRLRFWVRVVHREGPQVARTDWSDWLDVTLAAPPGAEASSLVSRHPNEQTADEQALHWPPLRPLPPVQIGELVRAPREIPDAPTTTLRGDNKTGMLTVWTQSRQPDDPLLIRRLLDEKGADVDLEFVSSYEFRITDLRTGARVFSPQRVQNAGRTHFSYGFLPLMQSATTAEFELAAGVYRVETRVQHVPVLLAQTEVDGYGRWYPIDRPMDAKNMATVNLQPSPWSDWGTPTEISFLPDGEAILPYGPSGTSERTASFDWGPVSGATSYEIWVQHRATGERVIRQNAGAVTSFTPDRALPTGHYLWWVRPVFSGGAAGEWSQAQHREIFHAPLQVSAPTQTVDATPVISWNDEPSAVSYTVEVIRVSDSQIVYRSSPLQGTSHRVSQQLDNGVYELQVIARFADGTRSAPGLETHPGYFQRATLEVGTRPAVTVSADHGEIRWDAVHGATRYEVWVEHISLDGTRTRALHETHVFRTQLKLPAESVAGTSGTIRVWVRAIRDEAGSQYQGYWSQPLGLHVDDDGANAFWSVWDHDVSTGFN